MCTSGRHVADNMRPQSVAEGAIVTFYMSKLPPGSSGRVLGWILMARDGM